MGNKKRTGTRNRRKRAHLDNFSQNRDWTDTPIASHGPENHAYYASNKPKISSVKRGPQPRPLPSVNEIIKSFQQRAREAQQSGNNPTAEEVLNRARQAREARKIRSKESSD